MLRRRFRAAIFALVAALLMAPPVAGQAEAFHDMTGTLGMRCFDDGSCAFGLSCNEALLCESCGGSGERACDGGVCDDGWGWGQVGAGAWVYCAYLRNDDVFFQNCGTAGFFMCPDTAYCRGASVPLGATRLCVGCGLLGQQCCGDGGCIEAGWSAVCQGGRCVPPAPAPIQADPTRENDWRQDLRPGDPNGPLLDGNPVSDGAGTWPPPLPPGNEGSLAPAPGQRAGEGVEQAPPAIAVQPPEDLPAILFWLQGSGVHACGCFASDGRNGSCRSNGCTPPAGYTMHCFWACSDAQGNEVRFDGATGRPLQ